MTQTKGSDGGQVDIFAKLDALSRLLHQQGETFGKELTHQKRRLHQLEARLAVAEKKIGIESGLYSLTDDLNPQKGDSY